MTGVSSYRELLVWQKSIDLALQVYENTKVFPSEERFGITSQLRRASTSVAANIAEGQARRTTGEFLQMLGIARGSLAEVETFVVLSQKLGYSALETSEELLLKCAEINKMLNSLMKSLDVRRVRSTVAN